MSNPVPAATERQFSILSGQMADAFGSLFAAIEKVESSVAPVLAPEEVVDVLKTEPEKMVSPPSDYTSSMRSYIRDIRSAEKKLLALCQRSEI